MITRCKEEQARKDLATIMQSVRALIKNHRMTMVSDVGDQHLKLLEKYDNYSGAVLYGHLDAPKVDEIAQEFIIYMKVHFAVEETLMAIIEYDDMSSHQSVHRRFLEDVGRLMLQIPLGMKSNEDLGILIGGWLLEHHQMADNHLESYVEKLC